MMRIMHASPHLMGQCLVTEVHNSSNSCGRVCPALTSCSSRLKPSTGEHCWWAIVSDNDDHDEHAEEWRCAFCTRHLLSICRRYQ